MGITGTQGIKEYEIADLKVFFADGIAKLSDVVGTGREF
jgi:hypothetical protein